MTYMKHPERKFMKLQKKINKIDINYIKLVISTIRKMLN
jgi:hypothetical protein